MDDFRQKKDEKADLEEQDSRVAITEMGRLESSTV